MIIKTNQLKRSFSLGSETVEALKGINLEVSKGEFISIMGPSGSGKTTLMNIIGCLDTPTSGEYLLNNQPVNNFNDDELARIRNKEIGFVYQFHHLLPDLTTIENIALPAMLSGVNKEEAFGYAQTLLEQVNLSGKEQNNPTELSGGERQRVAIARSMSNKPSCLIMDEPTGNLDSKNVDNFMNLLMDMTGNNKTTLIIATHDKNVSSRLDRLLSLE